MTRRLKAPQRRARRAAQLIREAGDRGFDLRAVAARSAGEPGMPSQPWPGDAIAFLGAVLEAHHLPAPLIRRLTGTAAAQPATALVLDRLSAALADQIHFAPMTELLRLPAMLLVGPPGAGKTTLAAKIAARLAERRPLLVTTDTVRPGAIAQLEEYAAVLGLPLAVARDAAELGRLVAAAGERSVVIDAAGAVPGDDGARARLAALIAASRAHPLLVLPADLAAEEAMAMVDHYRPLGARHLLPTRLDLAQRLGGLLTGVDAGRFALPAAGANPHFAFGLHEITPDQIARRMLDTALNERRAQRPAA